MNEPTPELIKEQQMASQEAASELLKAKEVEIAHGKPFRPDFKQVEIQEGVDAIVKPANPEATVPTVEVKHGTEVDQVEKLIYRFETENPVDVLNEVMAGINSGKVDPQTGQEFLSRVSGLESKDLRKSA